MYVLLSVVLLSSLRITFLLPQDHSNVGRDLDEEDP